MTDIKHFDVAVVGGGIGGLMAAYRIKSKSPHTSVCIIEQGKTLDKRYCPINQNKSCLHCNNCSITQGIGGSGSFSDGKYNLGTCYGGTLGESLGNEIAMDYIMQVDTILYTQSNILEKSISLFDKKDHIPSNPRTRDYPFLHHSNEKLKKLCLQNNLQLLDMSVRHLGTDRNLTIMNNLVSHMQDIIGINFFCETKVNSINIVNDLTFNQKIYNLYTTNGNITADKIVLALGRSGADFIKEVCNNFNVPISSNSVDIGVRVEMKDAIWQDFSSQIYEPKILCKTQTFEDKTRMFCFNQGGLVSAENDGNGIITANGHSFSDPKKKTDNCNFAILSSINFTEPFDEPTEYCKNIASLSNKIGNGNVLVQRFGDLIRGRRTNEHRLAQNSVIPTLNATAGDLSLVLPHRILTNIIETIYSLDKVAKGTANDDTLLYGVEAKYYSLKPQTDKKFQLVEDIYICGDCSGICRGLSQSGAMGLYVADKILEKISLSS